MRSTAAQALSLSVMTQSDSRIVLRDPRGTDRIVEHLGQPQQYADGRGKWEQTDRATNWRRVGGVDLRVYDLVEPMIG